MGPLGTAIDKPEVLFETIPEDRIKDMKSKFAGAAAEGSGEKKSEKKKKKKPATGKGGSKGTPRLISPGWSLSLGRYWRLPNTRMQRVCTWKKSIWVVKEVSSRLSLGSSTRLILRTTLGLWFSWWQMQRQVP